MVTYDHVFLKKDVDEIRHFVAMALVDKFFTFGRGFLWLWNFFFDLSEEKLLHDKDRHSNESPSR